MMKIDEEAIHKHLAAEMEGGLFAEVFLLSIFGETYGLQRVWYTVEDGIVYSLHGHKKTPTNNTLISVRADCRRVGDYDPSRFYPTEIRDFTYGQINNLLKKATHYPTPGSPSNDRQNSDRL